VFCSIRLCSCSMGRHSFFLQEQPPRAKIVRSPLLLSRHVLSEIKLLCMCFSPGLSPFRPRLFSLAGLCVPGKSFSPPPSPFSFIYCPCGLAPALKFFPPWLMSAFSSRQRRVSALGTFFPKQPICFHLPQGPPGGTFFFFPGSLAFFPK